MNTYKNLIRGTAVVVGLIYSVVLFFSGIKLDTVARQLLALIPTAAPAALVAYDAWIWRWAIAQKLNHRPRIDGLWRATLLPHPDSHIPDSVAGRQITAYVVIEQSYWTIAITQFTAESRSYSKTSTFVRRGESAHRSLSFLYDNIPRQEHRWRSSRHVGACDFNTPQGTPNRMEGYYFTDRFTQGEMTLELIDRTTNYTNFQQAHQYVTDKMPQETQN